MIHVSSNGTCPLITKASQLSPVIVDTLTMRVMKEGKVVSELPTAAHLNAMLYSESFLGRFRPVDQVAKTLLSRHLEESFEAKTDMTSLRVQLDGGFRCWIKGENPHMRHVFKVVEEQAVAEEK